MTDPTVQSGERCRWCEERYGDGRPDNFGSGPRCAFDSYGVFKGDNWNCAGINVLREMACDSEVWSEDQHAAVIAIPDAPAHVVLSYYKHRGRTEGAYVVDGGGLRDLNVRDVEAFTTTEKPE